MHVPANDARRCCVWLGLLALLVASQASGAAMASLAQPRIREDVERLAREFLAVQPMEPFSHAASGSRAR